MSVPSERIAVGRCYLAQSLKHLRLCRVVELRTDSRVVYEQHTPRMGWRSVVQDQRAFALMVEREVPCDWSPETDET
jgi:hypothetical protein